MNISHVVVGLKASPRAPERRQSIRLHVDTQVHCSCFSQPWLLRMTYTGISLSPSVYCKLPCHWRARARVSGLEGGGRGSVSRAVGEGRHSHFLRRERKKTSAHSLTSYLHIHSCLALCLREPPTVRSVCWIYVNAVRSHRSGRSGFANGVGGPFGGRPAALFLSIGSAEGLPVCLFVSVEIRSPAVWIFSHAIGVTLFDLCEERPGGWEGSVEKISMKLAVQ